MIQCVGHNVQINGPTGKYNMKTIRYVVMLLLLITFGIQIASADHVTGTISDSTTSVKIDGASITVKYGNGYSESSKIVESAGMYSFDGEGTYLMIVYVPGYKAMSTYVTTQAGTTVTQNFALVPTTDNTVVNCCIGTVKNTMGMPMSGVSVIIGEGRLVKLITDQNGVFNVNIVTPGSYHIVVSAYGYKGQDSYLTIEPWMTKITVTMSPTDAQVPSPTGTIWYTDPNGTKTTWPAISYDTINIGHQITLCKPIVTDNWYKYYADYGYEHSTCGIDGFNLSDYPLDVLPSGGNSGFISKSEVVMVAVNLGLDIVSYCCTEVPVHITWYRQDGSLLCPACDQYLYVDGWKFWTFSFVGHFSWEINQPGLYYVVVQTPFGSERLNYVVANTMN